MASSKGCTRGCRRTLPAALLFLVTAAALAHGQAGHAAASEPLPTTLARADTLFQHRLADSALRVLTPALERAQQEQDREAELRILLAQARILGLIGRALPTESAARQAIALGWSLQDTLAVRRALRWQAYALEMQGLGRQADSLNHRLLALAIAHHDREHEAHARLGLAYQELVRGEAARARADYEHVVALYHAMGNTRFELIAITGLGRAYGGVGDHANERDCYQRVAEGARRIGDPYREGDALNNLGTVEFTYGDPADALRYYERAYALDQSVGNARAAVVAATNIATARTYLGQHDDALSILVRALATCREYGFGEVEPQILKQMAFIRRGQMRFPEAATLFRQVLALGERAAPDDRAEAAMGLAFTLVWMGSAEAALDVAVRAEHALRSRVSPWRAAAFDRTTGIILYGAHRYREALARLARADRGTARLGLSGQNIWSTAIAGACYRALGRPDSAMACLTRAERAWEASRSAVRDLEWREQMGPYGMQVYMQMARVLLEYPRDRPEPERTRGAFDCLQRYKARVLYERMIGPPDSVSRRASPLPPATVDLATMQSRVLGEGELFLDYFAGSDESYLFAVTRKECRVVRLPPRLSTFRTWLARFHRMVSEPQTKGAVTTDEAFVASAGRTLGDSLLGPFRDLLERHRRVIVSADEALNLIPLGALHVSGIGAAPDDPLLATHEVVRVSSATLLATLRDQRTAGPKRARIVALANPSAPEGGRLLGAAREVAWLAREFRGVRSERLPDGSGQTPLTDRLAAFDVLHVAAHTRVDDGNPWRSGILMSAGASGGDDEYLRASRIAGLRLKARLAVLSGCESAGGQLVTGEGVLGLTGAFASAGVPAIVATLWPVSDRATERLIEEFYKGLARGESAAGALRHAQLALRAHPATRHPFYWAGFVLVGNGDVRVPLERRFPGPIAIALALIGLALVGLSVHRLIARRPRRVEDFA